VESGSIGSGARSSSGTQASASHRVPTGQKPVPEQRAGASVHEPQDALATTTAAAEKPIHRARQRADGEGRGRQRDMETSATDPEAQADT
jgi:hypothetical protein